MIPLSAPFKVSQARENEALLEREKARLEHLVLSLKSQLQQPSAQVKQAQHEVSKAHYLNPEMMLMMYAAVARGSEAEGIGTTVQSCFTTERGEIYPIMWSSN